MSSELSKRILSGIVLAAAVLFITWWHPISFAVMCAMGAVILWKEWRGLTRTRGPAWAIGGAVYILLAVGLLIALRQVPETGFYLVILLLLLVWAGDIGGFVVGRAYGLHKIAPRISPGKSWEGLAGSIAATTGVFYALAYFHHTTVPGFIFFGIAIVISCLGLAGDMFESSLKRRAGVKDSGTLIPGHGGLFDRVDALMPVTIIYGILYFVPRYLAGM